MSSPGWRAHFSQALGRQAYRKSFSTGFTVPPLKYIFGAIYIAICQNSQIHFGQAAAGSND